MNDTTCPVLPPVQVSNSDKIYTVAKNCLGKNLCGNIDIAYGCAQTVNAIVEVALAFPVGGGASTYLMFLSLENQATRFIKVSSPVPGDIIISPSGYSTKGVEHGHVGIVGKKGILSNSSSTGRLEEDYILESWNDYFGVKEGFPVYFFHAL